MEQVLTARAQGQSVRSCLQSLAGGDHSLMLRYQNKYRAVIKNRPEYVQKMVRRSTRAAWPAKRRRSTTAPGRTWARPVRRWWTKPGAPETQNWPAPAKR